MQVVVENVLVIGINGLFDNLYDNELVEVVGLDAILGKVQFRRDGNDHFWKLIASFISGQK